jgi:uncharacterized membrane protein
MSTSSLRTEQAKSRMKLTTWHTGWILLLIGIGVSAYLSYSTLFKVELQCVDVVVFDCAAVQRSAWSQLFGIPVALLGFGGYLTIGVLWYLNQRVAFLRENGLLILFALGLIGWLFSMWLLYVQIGIIDALCQWCLLHEVNFTLLFSIIVYRLWHSLQIVD